MTQPDSSDIQPQNILDIDLNQYHLEADTRPPALISPDRIIPADANLMASVGVSMSEEARSGTYSQMYFDPRSIAAQASDFDL